MHLDKTGQAEGPSTADWILSFPQEPERILAPSAPFLRIRGGCPRCIMTLELRGKSTNDSKLPDSV